MSLERLSAVSGVSRAAIGQIETQRSNPSLSVPWRLAVALGIPFGALLGVESSSTVVLRRAGSVLLSNADETQITRRQISPAGANRWGEAGELVIPPGCSHVVASHPPGTRETVVVIEGELRIDVGGTHYDLTEGDSASLPADRPRTLGNRSPVTSVCHDFLIFRR